MIIKKGYRLTVRSWEGDYDQVREDLTSGMSKQKVADLITILTFFKKSFWEGGLGNVNHHEFDEYIARIEGRVLPLEEAKRLGCTDADHITEIACDYLGCSDTYVTRMLDHYTVEFVPEDIKLKDVTSEFC